jgi:hypothetical protein
MMEGTSHTLMMEGTSHTLMMEGTSQLFIAIFGHTLMMAVMFLVWPHNYFVFYVEIEDDHHCWKCFNIAIWYSDKIT